MKQPVVDCCFERELSLNLKGEICELSRIILVAGIFGNESCHNTPDY